MAGIPENCGNCRSFTTNAPIEQLNAVGFCKKWGILTRSVFTPAEALEAEGMSDQMFRMRRDHLTCFTYRPDNLGFLRIQAGGRNFEIRPNLPLTGPQKE